MTLTYLYFNCLVLHVIYTIFTCANHCHHIIHLIHHTMLVSACMLIGLYMMDDAISHSSNKHHNHIFHDFIFYCCLFSCLISWLLLKDGFTALILASLDGHHQVVRTLLENGAAVNARNEVRNLMMMMMMMIVLTIMMMLMMMIAIHYEDIDDSR